MILLLLLPLLLLEYMMALPNISLNHGPPVLYIQRRDKSCRETDCRRAVRLLTEVHRWLLLVFFFW